MISKRDFLQEEHVVSQKDAQRERERENSDIYVWLGVGTTTTTTLLYGIRTETYGVCQDSRRILFPTATIKKSKTKQNPIPKITPSNNKTQKTRAPTTGSKKTYSFSNTTERNNHRRREQHQLLLLLLLTEAFKEERKKHTHSRMRNSYYSKEEEKPN
jgi:hypothetical protein